MNLFSRTISGLAAFIIGLVILGSSLMVQSDIVAIVWGVGSGIFFCGIGVYLFFNTKEDEIEEIIDSEE